MARTAPPEIGQVIRHAYLWHSEARRGQEEGLKDRPCVVIHRQVNEQQATEVFICPVTHTPPQDPERAIELPARTKARLGLDVERQWIITTEVNRFVWPGPDIRRTPSGEFFYGLLPGAFARATVEQVRKNARQRALAQVSRSPAPKRQRDDDRDR